MATRQKRVSRTTVKKETSVEDTEMLDQEDLDDALERAENLLEQKHQKVKSSPIKKKHYQAENDQDDEESGEDESYDSELEGFIAPDEEVEAELIQSRAQKQKRLKKKKKEHIKALDDEDVDLIRENVGIEVNKQKKRLKRIAQLEESSDNKVEIKGEDLAEEMQIDTVTKPQHSKVKAEAPKQESESKVKRQRLEYEDDSAPIRHKRVDANQIGQAQKIFGESHEHHHQQQHHHHQKEVTKPQASSNLKEFFNADEIDDPFNTEADLKIASTDTPERLQVKLENRFLPQPAEMRDGDQLDLQEEAEWVLERLTSIPDADNKYGKMIHAPDTRSKVLKVIKMFRCEMLDIPMIVKYRRYEYAVELDEDAIWHIFNLDQEYGKFQRSKAQVNEFLLRVMKHDAKIKSYIDELTFAKSTSELNNFNALIRYLRYQFNDQLTDNQDEIVKRKQPQSRDEISIARANRIHELSRLCFLECGQFQENLQYRKLTHQPPEPKASPATVAAEFASKAFQEETELLQAMCRYAAVELAAQPQIRNMMKKQIREHGQITANPTEQGKKDLDIFHQSYRVKLVENLPLKQLQNSDLYLDIMHAEKASLVSIKIELTPSKLNDFRSFLEECYMDMSQRRESWNLFRTLVIKILVDEILNKELIKEIRDEIQQEAETYIIGNCKRAYAELLMTGPFQTSTTSLQDHEMGGQPEPSQKKQRQEEIIKPKERLVVMGALMHQIDANNYIVTIAVVDKYGNLIHHKDFMRLLPPRIKKPRVVPGQPQPDPLQGERQKTDEELEHERDRAKLLDILDVYSVDLIVVAANSLEARSLKKVMEELGFDLKNKKPLIDEANSKKHQQVSMPKEAFVIWGSTEVAKLFSLSHNSQRLHKGVNQILKQTISLARFEQDPLTETLNLWSPITAENQALALNLDPMQKLVNQSRLADGLEEVNIRIVNKVGVDLNLVLDHEHLQCVLQFLSGLGPRMAKRLLGKTKAMGKKLTTRGELLKENLLPFKVYFSCNPFVLIRIPEEDFGKNQVQRFDILDQTRIHHEHYKLAMKIATDACLETFQHENVVEKTEQMRKCKEVIARPALLKNLDLKAYYQQLEMTNQGNMRLVIDMIIEELQKPFGDPRQPRTLTNLSISDERLFYLLIDESKRTFKRGLVVTATVSNVLESKVICRLENGLNATIIKEKILDPNTQEKLRDVLDVGFIITGRIDKILTAEGEKKFEVHLNCKKGDLHSHENYLKDLAESIGIDPRQVREDDKKNLNFAEDQQPKNKGRFAPRRIAHERFKNISSRRALAELAESEVGEFVFRPSTRSEDAITLTWKFWRKQFVHIDIQELDKMPGAAIGQRLMISNESYDNLREIVERYIIPCNRLVREVTQSPKWCDIDKLEDLEETLKEEKASDKGRIPYRFAILPQYHQHVVMAYVPREKVVKEFIKVRPKGFYFHEQNQTPFITLVNWFKDNWQTKDYQRFLKRQKSPRASVKTLPVIKETPHGDYQQESGANQWQAQGGGSVYSNQGYSNVKQESQQRSFGRGSRNAPKADSPGPNWQESRMKYEGGRSPAAWQQQDDIQMVESYGQPGRDIPIQRGERGGQDNRGGQDRGGQDRGGQDRPRGCFRCGEDGHMARECPNPDQRSGGGGDRGAPKKGCFNCGEDGHMSRECPKPQKEKRGGPMECFKCHEMGHMSRECPNQNQDQDRGGYKRQRMSENTSLKRNADGGYDLQSTGGWDDNNNQNQNNWGDQQQAYTPKQETQGGWNENARY